MARRYRLSKRLENSYKAYLRKREEFMRKGYALADAVSRKQYESDYEDAKNAGMSNNFARQMAYDDLRVTSRQSREIFRSMDEYLRNEYDIHSAKALRAAPDVHVIITSMFDLGLIEDRDEFERSLGY